MPNNPDKAIVIVGDDGEVYKLEESHWKDQKYLLHDNGGKGVVDQLVKFGLMVGFLKQDITGVGVGYACTIVNLEAILRTRCECDDEDLLDEVDSAAED